MRNYRGQPDASNWAGCCTGWHSARGDTDNTGVLPRKLPANDQQLYQRANISGGVEESRASTSPETKFQKISAHLPTRYFWKGARAAPCRTTQQDDANFTESVWFSEGEVHSKRTKGYHRNGQQIKGRRKVSRTYHHRYQECLQFRTLKKDCEQSGTQEKSKISSKYSKELHERSQT